MFSKPRPVPSKAALKFLYQLAYISSGTAAGVAALCAEERRRRTNVVQTIADNAKLLRQSPRHVHNAAALAEREEDYWQQAQLDVEELEDAKDVRKRRRHRTRHDRSARAPELPSIVGTGYGQVVEADYKRTRRREEGANSGADPGSTSGDATRPGDIPLMLPRRATKRLYLAKSEERMPMSNIHITSPKPRAVAEPVGLVKEKRLWRISLTAAQLPSSSSHAGEHNTVVADSNKQVAPTAVAEPRDVLAQARVSSALSKAPIPAESPPLSSQGAQDHDQSAVIEVLSSANQQEERPVHSEKYHPLLPNTPKGDNGGLSVVRKVEVTAQMKHEILTSGSPSQISSLFEADSSPALLTPMDVRLLCEKARDMAPGAQQAFSPQTHHEDREALFRMYERLIQSSAFQQLSRADQLHCALTVLLEAIGWGLGIPTREIMITLFGPILSPEETILGVALSKFCEGLLEQSRAGDAYELVRACRSWEQLSSHQWHDVEDKVFWALLDAKALDRCARLIKPSIERRFRRPLDRFQAHVEHLAVACGKARSYRPLVFALQLGVMGQGLDHVPKQLSGEAWAAIATAVTSLPVLPIMLFESAYRNVPQPMRRAVDVARTCTRLRDAWKRTHDFDAVLELYGPTKTFAASRDQGADLVRNIELTMVEICNSANQPDRALGILADMSTKSSHSADSLSFAAVALAKKESWKQLGNLFSLLEKSRALVSTRTVNRALNNVIHLYSRSHTAAETWNFVTGLIKNLGFAPNKTTSTIMLQCFVSKQSLELVPQWLRRMRTMGYKVQMDALVAADLVRYYYLQQRPPHVLLTEFCRDIIRMFPSFDTEALQNVVKESISYDLRNKTGQDKLVQREKAKTNMAALYSNGISTTAMRAVHDSRSAGPTWRFIDLTKSTPYAEHRSGNGTAVRPEQPFVSEAPIVESPEIEMHNETTAMTSHASYGLADQRRESELAAEERMQQLMEDFISDETDIILQPQPSTATTSEVGQDIHYVSNGHPSDATGDSRQYEHHVETNGSVKDNTELKSAHDEIEDKKDYIHDPRRLQLPVRDMIAAFSLKLYRRVVDLYYDSTSDEGLPASPKALEITLEASLRSQRGNPAEAEAILTAARSAGMNVSCAMAPMLLHKMWHSKFEDIRNANLLRVATIDFYRMNAENGWPVKHHVGVTAANILVNKGRAEHGINILNSIYHSEWAHTRDFDITPMTVYLRGYAALGSDTGLRWTLSTVLKKNLRIDRKFLDTLRSVREIYDNALKQGRAGRRSSNYLAALRRWRTVFHERREQQRADTAVFGRKLVRSIVKSVQESRNHVLEADVEIDRQSVGSQAFDASDIQIYRSIWKRRKAERRVLLDPARSSTSSRPSRPSRHPIWVKRARAESRVSKGDDATAELMALSGSGDTS